MSISEEFASEIYDRIREVPEDCKLNEKELEILENVLKSEVGIHALGILHNIASMNRDILISLRMENPESIHEFSRMQGRMHGCIETIANLLRLVTKVEETRQEQEGMNDVVSLN